MSLPKIGDTVTAGGDLAFRGDSSALVIVHTRAGVRWVAEVLELRPEKGVPLKPSEVCGRFVERLQAHGCSFLMADGHYQESITEFLMSAGLIYVPAPNRPVDAYVRARMLFRQGVVRLPNHPRLLSQLKEVQGRPQTGGGISIINPRSKTGGHGDILSALVLALYATGGDEVPQPKAQGSKAWEEEQRASRRKACQEDQERAAGPWWKARAGRPSPRR